MTDIDDLSKICFPAEDEYPILLALSDYVRAYEPSGYGELAHLNHAEAVMKRLAERYNARRRSHGHSELTFGVRPQARQASEFETALKELFLSKVLDEANTLGDLRQLVEQVVEFHEASKQMPR